MLFFDTIADASFTPCRLPYSTILFISSVATYLRLYLGLTLMPSNQTFLLPGSKDACETPTTGKFFLMRILRSSYSATNKAPLLSEYHKSHALPIYFPQSTDSTQNLTSFPIYHVIRYDYLICNYVYIHA